MSSEPSASPAKVAYHRQQLSKLIHRIPDAHFLELIWAIDALSAERPASAARVLPVPRVSLDQSITSSYALHSWELESLLIQLLLSSEVRTADQVPRVPEHRTFTTAARLVNRLRGLENAESAVYLKDGQVTIFAELHRIAQRTFHWQFGYYNQPHLYRYAFIYSSGLSGDYFAKTYGLTISEFVYVAFALY